MADHATQPHPDDQPVPVVDCALYKHGKRRAGTLPLTEAMDTARTSPDSFVWIGLREPTTDQLEVVADAFGLHPLAVEDAVHAHQRPKLERYDDSLFLVLKTVVYVEHDRLTPTSEVVSTGEIMIFAGRDFAVVVRHVDSPDLRVVRRQLETQPELLAHGPAAVVHAIADTVVDQYLDVVRAIETDVEQVEAGVFSPERTDDSGRIYQLKREVLELRRAVVPLAMPLRELAEARAGRRPRDRCLSAGRERPSRPGVGAHHGLRRVARRCAVPTSPSSPSARTPTCAGSARGPRSSPCPP